MNIATHLEQSAFHFPGHPAVKETATQMSYRELNARANCIATALLKFGVSAGDHIALCAPNSGDWLVFYFGVLKIGAVAVTLSSLLKRQELRMLLNHCRPKILFTFDDLLEVYSPLPFRIISSSYYFREVFYKFRRGGFGFIESLLLVLRNGLINNGRSKVKKISK